jgi:hypothetical protein
MMLKLMYSSGFCSVGLQLYNLKSPNLSLDGVYISCFDKICPCGLLLLLSIYTDNKQASLFLFAHKLVPCLFLLYL